MKIPSPAAESSITIPHTSPRKFQRNIPKKIARKKSSVRPPRTSAGDIFDIDFPAHISAGAPPTPAKVKSPLEKLRVWGVRRIPPPGEGERSVPFLSIIGEIRAFGAAATTAIAKNFLFNFFFFMFFVYFRSFFISFHFFHHPSSVPPIRAATPPPREGTWPP